MGFVNHGGMWGDLILLPFANSVIVPHLTFGPWIGIALAASIVASLLVHRHWYDRGGGRGDHPPSPASNRGAGYGEVVRRSEVENRDRGGDHVWPARTSGTWARDLSWSGWAHVLYVIGELTLLAGFLIHDIPSDVALLVAAVFTIHVPIGLLQPRYFLTGHIATVNEQPLLAPLLLTLWTVVALKI